MAHYCKICKCRRPSESFAGRGRRIHVCKYCRRRPKEERARVQETDEIWGLLRQSHISKKNIARLKHLVDSPDPKVLTLATLILEIGQVHPYKRRRMKFLAKERRDLLFRLDELGFQGHSGRFVPPDEFIEFIEFLRIGPTDQFDEMDALFPPDDFDEFGEGEEWEDLDPPIELDWFAPTDEFVESDEFALLFACDDANDSDDSQEFDDLDEFFERGDSWWPR
jgi:hypothetical protein